MANSELQSFPEYGISMVCPCVLKRDSLAEIRLKKNGLENTIEYSCTDIANSDKYRLQFLLSKSHLYSSDQILYVIDSTLKYRAVEHERVSILGRKGIVINYRKIKELELFDYELNYYLIIEAKDSIDVKFDGYINSILLN